MAEQCEATTRVRSSVIHCTRERGHAGDHIVQLEGGAYVGWRRIEFADPQPADWTCNAPRSYGGRCGTTNADHERSCGACGADRPEANDG